MDNKVNHFLVKVSDGVTLDNVVAAAKTNTDKIFFTPSGKIVVAGTGTDADGKTKKIIQYGVDNTEYGKISTALNEFIANNGTSGKTVKGYVDATTKNSVNDLVTIISNSDFANYDTNNKKFKNALTIKYIAATADKTAHIALVAKDGTTELSSINIADIIGNGLLSSSAYDTTTGELTLQFKNGSNNGTTPVKINLKALLDVDDIVVSNDSTQYLTTTTPTTTTDAKQLTVGVTDKVKNAVKAAESALQGANVSAADNITKNYVTLSSTTISADKHVASQTLGLNVASDLAAVTDADKKLVDAAAAKKYVDNKVADKNVTAEGDTYVHASAVNNKVTVSATDSTKKSLGLANTSIQEITATYTSVADGTTNILKLGGTIANKDGGGKSVTLNLELKKGEVKTTDDFAATPGFATASNIHDFVMAYVANALDNYNPWTTYTGA